MSPVGELRVRFLGKKGEITAILRGMSGLSPEERPVLGKLANELRDRVELLIEQKLTELKLGGKARRLREETLDVHAPGKGPAGRAPAPSDSGNERDQKHLPGDGVRDRRRPPRSNSTTTTLRP